MAGFFFSLHRFAFFYSSYNIEPMTIKNILKHGIPTKILAFIVAILILFIIYGVWTESNSGKIDIYLAKHGSIVFLDNKIAGTSNVDKQTITLKRVSPGDHSVIVSLQGYYPLGKNLEVKKGNTLKLKPFSINKAVDSSSVITNFTETQLDKINKLLKTSTLNKKISFSGDGNVEIKKDKNKIFATWLGDKSSIPDFLCDNNECAETTLVFKSDIGNVSSIDFYPGRDDVVIFSVGKNIYAIEIDKKGTQNFQPIYAGESPKFVVSEENSTLFVDDAGTIFGIML